MEKFNEIAVTVERREMGMGRAVFLMIATLLLWCGGMLLFLDLAANASGIHGRVALIGLVLVAIGGSCLWADFFEVTSWFAREPWVTGHARSRMPAAFLPKVLHKKGASVEENSQAEDAYEGRGNKNSEAGSLPSNLREDVHD